MFYNLAACQHLNLKSKVCWGQGWSQPASVYRVLELGLSNHSSDIVQILSEPKSFLKALKPSWPDFLFPNDDFESYRSESYNKFITINK